ncbi:MAG: NfeD family protein [Desulfotignum sp.]|nr:NfeD family protein [Desulfotignum sp.]
MNAYVLPVVLQLLGLGVIVVEIFVPSFGLLAALAAGLLLYSLYLVFTTISVNMGLVFVGVDIFVIPVVLVLGFKALGASSWSLHKTLSRGDGVASQSPDLAAWVGKEGVAVTNLRPSGTVMIGDTRLDAVTDGDYVSSGTPVRVTLVSGNRMVVEKIE